MDPSQKSTIGTLRTKEENSQILKVFPGPTWIGGLQVGSSGQWFWWGTHKIISKITTTFWTKGEPNNRLGNEACLMYNYFSGTSWNDDICSTPYMGLCEIRCV